MPTYHKIIKYGNSNAITLSRSELQHLDAQLGDTVIITPHFSSSGPALLITPTITPGTKAFNSLPKKLNPPR